MFFVGCMMLGIGIGMLFGQEGAGVMIGLGAGFILEGLFGPTRTWMRGRSRNKG